MYRAELIGWPAGAKFPGPLQRLARELWEEDMDVDLDAMWEQAMAKVGACMHPNWGHCVGTGQQSVGSLGNINGRPALAKMSGWQVWPCSMPGPGRCKGCDVVAKISDTQ